MEVFLFLSINLICSWLFFTKKSSQEKKEMANIIKPAINAAKNSFLSMGLPLMIGAGVFAVIQTVFRK